MYALKQYRYDAGTPAPELTQQATPARLMIAPGSAFDCQYELGEARPELPEGGCADGLGKRSHRQLRKAHE